MPTRDRIPQIGRPELRADAPAKVVGAEKYAADYYEPGLVWAGAKRAGLPHARLLGLDVEAARSLPGVIAVLTAADVAGTNRQGVVRKDQPVLVDDKIRHCGDAVALVLAEDRATLEKALNLIELEVEPLPAVFDPEEALKDGAPVIHEENEQGNVLLEAELTTGDGEAALGRCDAVVEAEFELPRQEHAYLETEAGWAFVDGDGKLTIVASTQTPFRDRAEVAEALGLEAAEVRVIAPYLGGGFGGKDGVTVQSLLGLAALNYPDRPIKMWWSREESFLAGAKRHAVKARYRLGAKADGTLEALAVRLVYDTGPYDHLGGVVMTLGLEHAAGPYRIPNVSLKGCVVYTNNPVGGPFRGFGVPQVHAAMEQTIDLLAAEVGLDPLEIRRLNGVRRGDKNAAGVTLTGSTGFMDCLDRLAEHPLWREREAWKAAAGRFKKRGVGVAGVMQGLGYGPVVPDTANAKIELTEQGRFKVYAGVADMGQGNASTYLQIAGEIMGQDAARLELVLPDTDQTLPSGSASASRTTYTFGRALIAAAETLKRRLLERAADMLMARSPQEIALAPGRLIHRPSGRELPLTGLARMLDPSERAAVGRYRAPTAGEVPVADEAVRLHGLPHAVFSYGAHLALIEVDELTGRVEVKKYLTATDCGRVMNPQLLAQQMHGGVVQGLGYALLEELVVEAGLTRTTDLSTYLIPTALDAPEMEAIAVETHESSGPYGLKGAGEVPINGPLPAVANAVADALGIRIFKAPLTAERVLTALAARGGEDR